MNKVEFWRLQKAANLSNRGAADYLGVSLRSIVKWRKTHDAPKAVMIAMEVAAKKTKG